MKYCYKLKKGRNVIGYYLVKLFFGIFFILIIYLFGKKIV